MMKVLCWSGGAQDGADNADGTQPSPETLVVSRFRYRTPVGMEPAGNPGLSGCLTAYSTCCVVWASLARSRSMVRMTRARLGWRAVQRAAGRVARANAPRRKGRGKSRAAADPIIPRVLSWRKFIVGDGGLALSQRPGDRLRAKLSDALVHEKVDLEVRIEGRTAERDSPSQQQRG